jgi:fibro-slime domain-containing protein
MVAMLSLGASPALALSFTGNYFILDPSHPDTLGGIDGVTVNGLNSLVNGTLSAGGLPVYSGNIPPASGAITDTSPAGPPSANEPIQWWTVHGGIVSVDSTVGGVRQDSFSGNVLGGVGVFHSDFFANNLPANRPADPGADNGYRTVHWHGAFHVAAGGANLSLTADDDAWLFLNNGLVLDNGGVKAISVANTVTTSLGQGDYVADLFFADRHQVQSGIDFICEGCLDPVPEPATLLLFGTTLAGLGAVVRRRVKGQKTPVA